MTNPMDSFAERLRIHFEASAEVKRHTASVCGPSILEAASLIAEAFRGGNKLLICGNGGSAADCQHMAAEFVSRLTKDFDRAALPAIALTTDTSFLTAFTNDCGYDNVFARQIEALGKPNDVLIGISTSGSSKNVIYALEAARRLGLKTVALTGNKAVSSAIVDVSIAVPSDNTQYIQESHLAVEHVICEAVEVALFA